MAKVLAEQYISMVREANKEPDRAIRHLEKRAAIRHLDRGASIRNWIAKSIPVYMVISILLLGLGFILRGWIVGTELLSAVIVVSLLGYVLIMATLGELSEGRATMLFGEVLGFLGRLSANPDRESRDGDEGR